MNKILFFLFFYTVFSRDLFTFWIFNPLKYYNERGNKKYSEKKYDDALIEYGKAEENSPRDSALKYNLANTLYRQGQYDKAGQIYEQALEATDPNLLSHIYFNRGNTFFRKGEYDKAILDYKEVLLLNPDDRDAKLNMELARKKLREHSRNKENYQSENQQASGNNQQQKKSESGGQNSGKEKQNPGQQPKNKAGEEKERGSGRQEKKIQLQDAVKILDALKEAQKKSQAKMMIIEEDPSRPAGPDW
ncbi:MAG: hypothetical protein A2096_01915 [Spirochaetes bacterium GWF1_41_5]|nr:MAG: hypothetical protein A2096_01915 [Spirochaetes bacterium GWF1_41_5]